MLQKLHISYHQASAWQQHITHHSDEYHFYIITYGSCQFKNEQIDMIANKGDFVIAPANCSYIEQSAKSGVQQKYSFSFVASQPLIEELPLLKRNQWIQYHTGIYDLTVERFRPLHKQWTEDQPYSSLRIQSLIVDTLALWQRELDRGELSPASDMLIDRMKEYIQTHYREHITKERLADYIHRSPSYAATLFRKGTGQTISEYVHAIRMKTAMYLLSASLLSITEIAEYLGYNDVSYFQRIFKRSFGQPASFYMNERERDFG